MIKWSTNKFSKCMVVGRVVLGRQVMSCKRPFFQTTFRKEEKGVVHWYVGKLGISIK